MGDPVIRRFKVPSKSNPGEFQEVVLFDSMAMECTCTSFQYRKTCSHVGIVKKIIDKENYDINSKKGV